MPHRIRSRDTLRTHCRIAVLIVVGFVAAWQSSASAGAASTHNLKLRHHAAGSPALTSSFPTGPTFGHATIGASTNSPGSVADVKRVIAATPTTSGRVTKLSIYLGPSGTSGTQVLRGVIYADSNGAPGALLAVSSELAFSQTSALGWYDLTVSAAPQVNAGTRYWIGLITGGTARVVEYYYDAVSNARYYNTNTYTSGATTSFGRAATDSQQISVYATTAASGSPTNTAAPVVTDTTSSGRFRQGDVLSTTAGTWTGGPVYSYQWQDCTTAGILCRPITGATGLIYALTSGDVGSTVRVVVTGTNVTGATSQASVGSTTVTSSSSGGGGNGTLLFNGTFDSASFASNYPTIYGNCYSNGNSLQEQFTITSSCNPAGNGHYRTDFNSFDTYFVGTATCTTVPISFVSVPLIANKNYMLFAEAKDIAAQDPGWALSVESDIDGRNEVTIGLESYNGSSHLSTPNTDIYYTTTGLETGWHTWSICTNNAQGSSGVVDSIWHDGARLTINHGSASGQQSVSGVQVAPDDGASRWPLTTDNYTSAAPGYTDTIVPNTIIHGAPLIATIGSNGQPPEPSGGWTSP